MTDITQFLAPFFMGIIAISFIDIFGAITSRRLKYNYAYLMPLSFIAYTAIGYTAIQIAPLTVAISIAWLVGIYDATLGWDFAIMFKANRDIDPETVKRSTVASRIVVMLIVSGFFGFLGSKLGILIH